MQKTDKMLSGLKKKLDYIDKDFEKSTNMQQVNSARANNSIGDTLEESNKMHMQNLLR